MPEKTIREKGFTGKPYVYTGLYYILSREPENEAAKMLYASIGSGKNGEMKKIRPDDLLWNLKLRTVF